jgi:CopA family copper-resistance protein
MLETLSLERRGFLRAAGIASAGAALGKVMPAWAQSVSMGMVAPLPTVSGSDIALSIGNVAVRVDGKVSKAIGINGTVPGPLIRLKQGQGVRLRVTNTLPQASSIHWHGVLVPFAMDGVPGVSFPGIAPGETFDYSFPIVQAGTYWYHSHSGYQEQDGLYGPIVIDPVGPDPVAFDREHVIVLSDHSPMLGATIFRKLKQMGGGYFNMQRQTLSGLISGRDQTQKERLQWARMRMDPADIADVTGSTYTFTINGHGPFDNWTGLITPGERVRLRIINAASQTNFNVRIPDLPMTVVAADGQNVRPVKVDEFQIGVAETFDVIVTPSDRAYTFVSESIDRSGLGRATLAPRAGMRAPVPPIRQRSLTTMMDMGMGDMGGMARMDMTNPAKKRGIDSSAEQNASRLLAKLTGWREPTDHGSMSASSPASTAGMVGMPAATTGAMTGMPGMSGGSMAGMPGMSGPATGASGTMGAMPGMGHSAGSAASTGHSMSMSMNMRDGKNAPGVKMGPGVQTISPMPTDRSGEAPQGLDGLDHRVLVYRDLVALERNPDVRAPSRALDIHLTGNMERYMWSFDGVKLSDPAEPIPFRLGERVRITLINDTMMPHPIHIHGHFFELVTGHGASAPRKHTVNVPPGGKVGFDLTANAPGDWAFHCHNLYHMTAGMMRVVTVRPAKSVAA